MLFTRKKRTGKNVQASGMRYFPRFIPYDEE
jgi:hypothetical protein